MARTVYGRIVDQRGRGVPGLRVQAWDDDWPDGDDLMGTDITNHNGDYRIHYRGGHWDPGPHRLTRWRPDIFISVSARTRTGDWAHLARSQVHPNHRLKKDLRINQTVRIQSVEKHRTGFDVARHGFRFVNRFVLEPSLFGFDLGSWEMGLCGGMCAAALNRYRKKRPIPPDTTPPRDGTPLFSELLQRQKKTIPPTVMTQIYNWQSAPDEGQWNRKHSVGYLTKQQWPTLRRRLAAGKPTQLVLIRVEGYLANPTANHQVLAIGYEWDPVTRDLTVHVYDPNVPGIPQRLVLNLGLPNSRLRARYSTGERVRGFFVNPAGKAAAK